ncbi:hypothetical protein GCM10009678_88610 [Actinomadura kijaniata]|uniref:Glycerophosphoryl diester phosphodiesterase membrane domain-containing protein n=1 Tax=Actinomadura namibiensis TaxID=182080 RepID=A0A7W3LUZ8_ACTNM|nr:hypothetical protein [Actinomadura namibiensis]MBA8954727.1 hypothetical protein [Actinomadura namibiensis]
MSTPNDAPRLAGPPPGSPEGDVPFRPLSMSEMLDGAIAGIRRAPRTVLGVSVAVSAVIQVAGTVAAYYFVGEQARDEVTPGVLLRSLGSQVSLALIGLVLSAYGIVLLSGLLAPVLGRSLFGLPAESWQVWRDARPRLGRLAAVALVIMGAALLGLLLPVTPFLLLVAAEAPVSLCVLAGLLGFPAGIALMVWLYVLLVLAAPAVVLERESVGGALARARRLSRGRWWRTCGTLLLALLITVFMGFFALRIPFLVAQLVFFGTEPEGGRALGALALDTFGRIVSWSVVLPFDAGVIALLYMDRRMRREGLDLDLRTRRDAPTGDDPHRDAPHRDDPHRDDPDGDAPGDDGFFTLWRPAWPSPRPAPAPFPPPAPHPRQMPREPHAQHQSHTPSGGGAP